MKKQKIKSYEVNIPVAYYESFFVSAHSRAEAIQRVVDGHESCYQKCTDANPRWSKRIIVYQRGAIISKYENKNRK